MRKDLKASESILINADVAKVWDTLTNPEKIKLYLYGTDTVTDWIVDHEIIFQGEYEGHKYLDHGVILENIPLKKIAYSYWSGFSGLEDLPENYSTVVYEFEDVGNGSTNFTWKQIGYASEKSQQHSQEGLKAFIETIKEIAEQ